MDKYDRCAAALMELGDSIIEEKKKKSALIRRVSFSVSGLCAAALLCFGILKTPALQKPPEIPVLSGIVDATDAPSHAETATVAEVTETTEPVTTKKETKEEKTTVTRTVTSVAGSEVKTTASTPVSSPADSRPPAASVPADSAVQPAVQTQDATRAAATTAKAAEATVVYTTLAAVKTTEAPTESPVEPPTESPIEPPTESPIEPPTESPIEPPTESPVEQPSDISQSFIVMNELGGKYMKTSGRVEYSILDSLIKDTVLTDTTASGEIKADAKLFSIQGIAPEVMTAVSLNNASTFTLYRNTIYKPATLGEFMEVAGIKKYASFEEAVYYNRSGGYEEREYTDIDSQAVMDILLGCEEAECCFHYELMPEQRIKKLALACDMTPALPLSRLFTISEAGYLTTNLTESGLSFNIGKDKAEVLIRMIIENYQYTVNNG